VCGGRRRRRGRVDRRHRHESTTSTSATTTLDSSASLTGDESSESDASTSEGEGSTGADESTGPTTSDTGVQGCAGLDQVACQSDPACKAVVGSPHEMMGDSWCIGMREFIECQDAAVCDQVITTACENKDTTVFQFADSCIPTGWSECPPPDGGPFNAC